MSAPLDLVYDDTEFATSYGDVVEIGEVKPIDKLRPDSTLHESVLRKLTDRLQYAEDHMQMFYHRWAVNESKIQAYITLPDWEKILKQQNENMEAPHPVRIIVPFGYAAHSTLVTFLIHTFAGRNPMFQLGTNKQNYVQAARNTEMVLQYNADHTRLIRTLWQHYNDIGIYGLGAKKIEYEETKGRRTRRVQVPQYQLDGGAPIMGVQKTREMVTTYSGNKVTSIDPFMFFPDPRVPMAEVNRRGEFCFDRAFTSRLNLKASGDYKFIEHIKKELPECKYPKDSRRGLLSRGIAFPGTEDSQVSRSAARFKEDFVQVDQGTVRLIPSEWGLGSSNEVELWQFAIGNKSQIIQAEPYDCDHDMHPYAVAEPYGFGYAFGQPGPADFIGPIQDLVSWLVNSHIDNVRAVLNDMWVVDPSKIEMGDLAKSGPGKRIRLKKSAWGTDVRTAIMQLPVTDVTSQHLRDAELFMRMGMLLMGLNENIMGQPQRGGRATATESRQTAEAAVSRLAQVSRIISAQSGVDMTEMMVLNLQQFMEDDFYAQIVGAEGVAEGRTISPGDIVGDFHYPIHDGTMPLDRIALLEVWERITQGVAADPELRARYDIGKIFEYTAELGGAQNIEGMRKIAQGVPAVPQEADEGQIGEALRQGNLVPVTGEGGNDFLRSLA